MKDSNEKKTKTTDVVYDVVLTNGRVIDAETYTDGIFNVGITGDRIAAISAEPLKGKDVVDATGKIVCPGFIDLHAHSQNIGSNRIQAFDGLTTALDLESGVLPVSEFYDKCAKEGRPINYGASSAWGGARIVTFSPQKAVNGKPVPSVEWFLESFDATEWVMGLAEGETLQKILDMTEEGLKEGGIGVGVPWGYAPGAGMKELLGIWKLAKKYNVPTYTHIQNLSMVDPNSGTKNIVEMIGLAASTGAKTHICHLNSVSLRDIPSISQLIKTAQSAGIPITTEAYSYGAGNGPLGAAEFDPEDVQERLEIDWSDLTAIKTMKDFQSKEEVVKARKEDPNLSTIIHYLREDDNAHDASLLDMSVLFPGGAVVTDGLPYTTTDGKFFHSDEWPLPEGLSNHPRAAGNYCRFLRKWVRERGVISWMDAMRYTSLNAAKILEDSIPEMKNKGRIQVGADADILVFDPETVSEQADFRNPARLSKGMHHVIINGTFLIRDEELDTNALPGKPIRAKITA